MDQIKIFQNEVAIRIKEQGVNGSFLKAKGNFIVESIKSGYSYNFLWLGRPIIQYPQDIVAIQEIIWEVKPDLIIETGIAHGGSLILSASMLTLLEICGEIDKGSVVGIDIEIRQHNRIEIEKHPLNKKITMFEGSSITEEVVNKVKEIAKSKNRILVFLDSNHTHEHVLKELELYSPFVSQGSYMVVFDTIIEDLPEDFVKNRPWGKGNNPKTAVWEFLKIHNEFEIDKEIENKLLITVAPDGYLKRMR
ncbi:cephalosporin hydroxylase family protein [Patescibacteria group bacterium]|nr:cephalosporin hydroxylase family protein [Patescibacteria group bacterium]